MKITIERSQLLKTLGHAHSVVERRNTIPILANVLLKAGGDRLHLAATDMDIGIVESVAALPETEGETTAPAHILYDIARKLPDGAQVELETLSETGQIRLRSGRSTFTLATLPTEEFPAVTEGELDQNFVLSAQNLRQLVDRSGFAASTEETRYYLNGIYMHATEHEGVPVLRAVATDGHRLARVEVPLPEGAEGMPGVIVPRKAVSELRKLLEGVDEDVSVSLSETKIHFSLDEIRLTSKLIDGTFPDYERVIPVGNDKELRVTGAEMITAVDRVSTISVERTRAVKLSISDGVMKLSATGNENGCALEEIEVQFEAGSMEIGFNARYLLDILRQISGETVAFDLSDPAAPTLVRDMSDTSALYVLMPLRV